MKAIFFNQKPNHGRPIMGECTQSSASPSGANVEHLSMKHILGEGGLQGRVDLYNAIDCSPKIDDLYVAV